ncbi:hypothetical protein [Sorangium sp. So ce1000]|uniref:hypothetical protein n=1 Tax=Sorangium sp. So ce1000 TaxID=3133325 RepID=UPI003F608FE0
MDVKSALSAHVDRETGAVSFTDPSGASLLAEVPNGRAVAAATVQGQATHNVHQRWMPARTSPSTASASTSCSPL